MVYALNVSVKGDLEKRLAVNRDSSVALMLSIPNMVYVLLVVSRRERPRKVNVLAYIL